MSEKVNIADRNSSKEGAQQKKRASEFDYVTRDVLDALRKGDHDAFDLVYIKCAEPMLAFFRLIMQNETDAEELCQELFVKLWEQRERIDPDSNFRSYLYTIAKTSALQVLRHRNVQYKFQNFKQSEGNELDFSADSDMIYNEVMLILEISLKNMPAQRRKVFEMSRVEGLTNEEIAKKLNISTTTVRSHIYNVVKELKELIALVIILISQ